MAAADRITARIRGGEPTPAAVIGTRYTKDVPHDRFTRLANVGLEAIGANGEHRKGDKILVCVDTDQGDRFASGGFASDGFDGLADLLVTLLEHARALLQGSGLGHGQLSSEGTDLVLRLSLGRNAAALADGPVPDPHEAADAITAIIMSAIADTLTAHRKGLAAAWRGVITPATSVGIGPSAGNAG